MADSLSIAALWRTTLARLELADAVVFADDPAASALACAVGLPALLELGARNVVRLGDAPGPEAFSLPTSAVARPPLHAVVLCSTFLPEAYAALRNSLCDASRWHFGRVTLACGYSDRAHAAYSGGSDGEEGAYEACRAEFARWLRAPPPQLHVLHIDLPLSLCAIGSGVFLLPSAEASPLLESSLSELRRSAELSGAATPQRLDELPWSALDASTQRALGGCACGLAGMLKAAGVRPVLFSMGTTSTLLARQLMQHLPAAPPATATGSGGSAPPAASLLIVDRSLDYVSPLVRADHPLEQLLATPTPPPLPTTSAEPPASPGNGGDGRVGDAWAADADCGAARHATAPPLPPIAVLQQLAAADPACAALLDSLLTRRGKEVRTRAAGRGDAVVQWAVGWSSKGMAPL